MNSTSVKLNSDIKDKAPWGKVLIWTLLFQLAWHFDKLPALFGEGALPGSDDFLRLHQIRNWLSGQSWFDLSVARMYPPIGGDLHWPRLIEVPIAALIKFFDLFVDIQLAERIAVFVWPTLILFVTVVVLVRVSESLYPQTDRLVTLLFSVTCITSFVEFTPGRIDHHNVQIMLFSFSILGLVSSAKWWGHLLIGLSIAMSLAIGLDLVLMLMFLLAWLGIEWALGHDVDGRGLRNTAIALLGSAIVLFFLTVKPEFWFSSVCDANSIVYLSAETLIAVGFIILGLLTSALTFESFSKTLVSRICVGVIIAACIAGGLAVLFPACISGPLSGISQELNDEWLIKVLEAKGLFQLAAEEGYHWLSILIYVIIVITGGFWLFLKGANKNFKLLAISIVLLLYVLLSIFQLRALRVGMFATVPICVMLVQTSWELLSEKFRDQLNVARVIQVFVVLLLLSPTWLWGGALLFTNEFEVEAKPSQSAQINNKDAEDDLSKVCEWQSDYDYINTFDKALILNENNIGPAILINTNHDIVGAHYHRNEQAILDSMRFYRYEADQAWEIANRLNPDFVVYCPRFDKAKVIEQGGDMSMTARIARNDLPDWLELLSHPDERLIVLKFVN